MNGKVCISWNNEKVLNVLCAITTKQRRRQTNKKKRITVQNDDRVYLNKMENYVHTQSKLAFHYLSESVL